MDVSDIGIHRRYGTLGRKPKKAELGSDVVGVSVFGFNASNERESPDSVLCS